MTVILRGAVAAAALLLASAPALADCKPQQLLASVDLQPTSDGTANFIPITMGTAPKTMMFDTGAAVSTITSATADELQLKRMQGNLEIVDIAGQTSRDYVRVPVALGTMRSGINLVVMPGSELHPGLPGAAGLFGADILRNFDVDADFGTHKLNLISPDHCEGKVIYWPAEVVAAVPMTVQESGHIVIPVKVDGHTIYAMLDTGASNTALTQTDARTLLDVTMGDADTPRVGDLQDSPGMAVYEHVFKTMEFEGITISNPHIELIPDRMRNRFINEDAPDIGTKIHISANNSTHPRMLIGMNILKHFHIYIAYGEKRLYITPAGDPAAATPAH